ncbi:cytochrome c oxidase assembly factor 1 homolog [Gadus macrocephalus]|uniref:cytochrome c oxidase assembly factor 1 homolog n=1 Tax=Gadus macrocephalus TaxID=80720 RepID=UPI0028CB61D9|nr:cytochrome c oxidase assembly factor 1 homolog [Gadus macrocephalus]
MRISTHKLQQLTIFTTVLTGGGICTMYYLMQKNFAKSEYHRLAVERLENHPEAMEGLGAPPLKVHNIHLSDKDNRIDQNIAKVKIPVTGSKTGGYLYTIASKDPATNGWQLKLATLQLREGRTFDLLTGPEQPSVPVEHQAETREYDVDLDQSKWSR